MEPVLWMWPGIMPILHSPGLMMPGQLGPDERETRIRSKHTDKARLALLEQGMLHTDHVLGVSHSENSSHLLRDALRDAHTQRNFRCNGFQDGSGSARRGDIDDRGIGTRSLASLDRVTRRFLVATSETLAKTGRFKCFVPALAGETPPTMFVPYSIAFWV